MTVINYEKLVLDEKTLYKTYYFQTGKTSEGEHCVVRTVSPKFFFLTKDKEDGIRQAKKALDAYYDKEFLPII
jgi:hypothetical protein